MTVKELTEKYELYLSTGNKLKAVAMLYHILKDCKARLVEKQIDVNHIQIGLKEAKDLVDESPTGKILVKLLKERYADLFKRIRYIKPQLEY